MSTQFVDIHCHILPAVDDGAVDLAESLAMAEMAAADGIRTIILTPHQLGRFSHNLGDNIRHKTAEFQYELHRAGIALTVLPGADVRIEDGLVERLAKGDVLTLGDHRRHVLLELPHELYFPLEGLLASLRRVGITGILSHPERNAGLLEKPKMVSELVDAGCLMQVTAGSYTRAFGVKSQQLAQWMLGEGLVHFVATDAHGPHTRRPLMRRTYDSICELAGPAIAQTVCCDNPARVAAGLEVYVPPRRRRTASAGWRGLFARKAG